jgi:hypothetical protein
MGDFILSYVLELALLIIGFFLGGWFYTVIILPLFWGIPKSVYYIYKKALKKSAVLFYLKTFILWNVIFIVAAITISFLPSIAALLKSSLSFALGQILGIIYNLVRSFTINGRDELNTDFWACMEFNNYSKTKDTSQI